MRGTAVTQTRGDASARPALAGATETIVDCAEGTDIDTRALRQALSRFATGITVVTTCTPSGKLEGLTANSFTSVSLDPPLILWSLRKAAPSFENFVGARWFAINVLSRHQEALSQHFATAAVDKFAGLGWAAGVGGCPLLPETLARYECQTESIVEAGDHNIFIGRIVRATHCEGEALVYNAGRYCGASQLPS